MESQTTIENSLTEELATSPLSVPLTISELQSFKEEMKQSLDEAYQVFLKRFEKEEGSDKK